MVVVALTLLCSLVSALVIWGGRRRETSPISDAEWAEGQAYLQEYDRQQAARPSVPPLLDPQ